MEKVKLDVILNDFVKQVSAFVRNERYLLISLLREKGVSDAEIARRLGVTRQWVWINFGKKGGENREKYRT